jgi:heat shock protein HslJ
MHPVFSVELMQGLMRRSALGIAMAFSLVCAAAAASNFPYGQDLMLESHPIKGTKRVPLLDIQQNGSAEIDLWCNSVRAQAVISRNEITITAGDKTDRVCAPEQMSGDDDMLSALSQVTTWRLEGDTLILSGPRTIRFRMESN